MIKRLSVKDRESYLLPFEPVKQGDESHESYSFTDLSDLSEDERGKVEEAADYFSFNHYEEPGTEGAKIQSRGIEAFLGKDLFRKANARLVRGLKDFNMEDGGLWIHRTTKKAIHCPDYEAPYTNFIVYREWDSVEGVGKILVTTDINKAILAASK